MTAQDRAIQAIRVKRKKYPALSHIQARELCLIDYRHLLTELPKRKVGHDLISHEYQIKSTIEKLEEQ